VTCDLLIVNCTWRFGDKKQIVVNFMLSEVKYFCRIMMFVCRLISVFL
jgi:hypothetical protein